MRVAIYTLDEVNAADVLQRIRAFGAEAVLIQTLADLLRAGRLDGLVVDVDGLRVNVEALTGLDALPCPITAFSTYGDWTLAETWRREGATLHKTVHEALATVFDRLRTATREAA